MHPDTTPFQSFHEDHAHVLGRLDALERWIGERGRSDGRTFDDEPIRTLVALLDAQFATHMRDEEELLFPALAESLPEAAPSLAPLRAEHAELRQMLGALTEHLGRAPSPTRDEQIVVHLRDFVDLLRLHVNKEEAAVFKVAARLLPSSEVEALSQRIAARRERRAAPSPRRSPS